MNFQNHADCGQAAMDIGDWMTAAKELELCQEILKYAGYHKLIDLAVFDWLLVWVNASLAHVYQFCLRKFSEYRFVELREDMVEIVEDLLLSNNNCEAGDLVNVVKKSLCTAMYEFWAYASLPSDAKEKENAIKSFAILTGLPEDECESELCQLLSLNHKSAGNNEDALQWVRKAKTLWTEKFPGRVNYDILHMEADIMLFQFKNVEEAIVILKDVSAAMESMPLERGSCSDPKPKGFNLNTKKAVHGHLSSCYEKLRQRAAADGEFSKAKQFEEGSVQELQEADKILDSDEMREIELLIKDADEHMTNREYVKA
jgi:tetratricopeptide (TPR) repeat protein